MRESTKSMFASFAGVVLGAAVIFGAFFGYRTYATPSPVHEGDFASLLAELGHYDGAPIALMREGCPACGAAKEWLAASKRSLRLVYTHERPDAAALLKVRLDINVVPVLVTRERVVVGFDPKDWEGALATR